MSNKWPLKEELPKKFNESKCFLFPWSGSVESLVVNSRYCCEQSIFNRTHFTSAVQASNHQQQWWQPDAAREPQEFLEFVNESGWGSAAKIWCYSTHRWGGGYSGKGGGAKACFLVRNWRLFEAFFGLDIFWLIFWVEKVDNKHTLAFPIWVLL